MPRGASYHSSLPRKMDELLLKLLHPTPVAKFKHIIEVKNLTNWYFQIFKLVQKWKTFA